MRSTTRYYISLLLIFVGLGAAFAQQKKVAKPKKDFSPAAVRFGTDLIDLGKTFSGTTFSGYEVNTDVGFANYYLTADVGSWAKNLSVNNGTYGNSGSYYRWGIDVNFLEKDPDKNMFFLGFRVGHASFSEHLSYQATSLNLFSPATINASNGHVTGGWAEITTGLRVKVWKGFWMGYTARMKFAPSTKGSNPTMAPYDMPGYGIVQDKPWWGFNYQLFWKFNWKKEKPTLLKK